MPNDKKPRSDNLPKEKRLLSLLSSSAVAVCEEVICRSVQRWLSWVNSSMAISLHGRCTKGCKWPSCAVDAKDGAITQDRVGCCCGIK